MQIIGRGLIAQALAARGDEVGDAVVFASGVADSSCRDPLAYRREVDLLGSWLQSCLREDRRLVYFSSAGAVYGRFAGPRDEQTPCAPNTAYGRHKLECEAMIRASGCRHLILRVPNLVGPRQNPHQLVPALIQQALVGRAVLFRDATRDLVGVDRFAQVVPEVLANAGERETVVMASGTSLASAAIFQRIQRMLGTHADVDLVPRGDRQQFQIDKLRRLAPRTACFTDDEPRVVLEAYVPALAADLGYRDPSYALGTGDPTGPEAMARPIP